MNRFQATIIALGSAAIISIGVDVATAENSHTDIVDSAVSAVQSENTSVSDAGAVHVIDAVVPAE